MIIYTGPDHTVRTQNGNLDIDFLIAYISMKINTCRAFVAKIKYVPENVR